MIKDTEIMVISDGIQHRLITFDENKFTTFCHHLVEKRSFAIFLSGRCFILLAEKLDIFSP